MTVQKFCEYKKGVCDDLDSFDIQSNGFFIYPSVPTILSQTVSAAVRDLQKHSKVGAWRTWEDLSTTGQIIFCQICGAINSSKSVVANITTLNFNVLFEIGYAIGMNKTVIPVRDTSFEQDKELFEEIGIFDVLGYEDFKNSQQLRGIVTRKGAFSPIKSTSINIDNSQPTYLLKSPYDSDGSVRLLSSLKKSALYRFRTFDPKETKRLSLHEAIKQVDQSIAIIAHMIDDNRKDAKTHNALCAFVSGLAMAKGKHVLMLKEGNNTQPIDYRDVLIPYSDHNAIPFILNKYVRQVSESLYNLSEFTGPSPTGLLEKIDLGNIAAENEIRSLVHYFVKTPPYQQARQGHARLVVGRKGSGKTAIFYAIRNEISQSKNKIILGLKPEGHHFTKLRELVLDNLSEGIQLHTLISFWNYLLLLELAKKIIEKNRGTAWQNPDNLKSYDTLKDEYEKHNYDSGGDFSERILALVEKISEAYPKQLEGKLKSADITRMIYSSDIKELTNLVIEHIQDKDEVWLLFDNIDKGWSIKGASSADIALVRSLLEATRKIQRQLENKDVNFNSVVFLRKDISDLLIDHTPDRGKESIANLDWSDQILIEELLRKRFASTEEFRGNEFREIWRKIFDVHVGGMDSFLYILERSSFHPRSVLNFVTKCIQTSISREHQRVQEDDILFAERAFSEDTYNNLKFEIRDVFPKYPKLIQYFIGKDKSLSKDDIELLLLETDIENENIDEIIEILLWFSFLGVDVGNEIKYSSDLSYDLEKLKTYISKDGTEYKKYFIHPAFHLALDLV